MRHSRYVAEFNPRAGARLAADLFAAWEDLAFFPMRGRPIQYRNARELATIWPYVIVYRIDGQTVEVLRVWHGAQDRSR